jgi:hypothetical protein
MMGNPAAAKHCVVELTQVRVQAGCNKPPSAGGALWCCNCRNLWCLQGLLVTGVLPGKHCLQLHIKGCSLAFVFPLASAVKS